VCKGHRGGGGSWGLSGSGCPHGDVARGEHARASWAEPLRRAPHSAVCRRRGGAWQISSSGGDWSGSELVVTRPTGLARHARALREQSSGATGRG
jgi:hypothetical protein